jgi:hypothetical protein
VSLHALEVLGRQHPDALFQEGGMDSATGLTELGLPLMRSVILESGFNLLGL